MHIGFGELRMRGVTQVVQIVPLCGDDVDSVAELQLARVAT